MSNKIKIGRLQSVEDCRSMMMLLVCYRGIFFGKGMFNGRFLIPSTLATAFFYYLISSTSLKDFQIYRSIYQSGCCFASGDRCGPSNCTFPCSGSRSSDTFSHLGQERAFFVETSGRGSLNFRQACSVESLAIHNANISVNVLFVGGKINETMTTLKILKQNYENVRFISINLDDYLAGTPLENWYYCSDWRDGPFAISHLSDGLRFLTVYKYGGYYFDLDIIFLKSITFYRNFVAAEDDDYLGSSVIHAEIRNPILEFAVKDFATNYRSDIPGHNGPALLLRVMKEWCGVADILSMDYLSCQGFNVLHYSSFCPVHSSDTDELFVHRLSNDNITSIWLSRKVVGVHTWNRLTYNRPVFKNSTQYYSSLARVNCPKIYDGATNTF